MKLNIDVVQKSFGLLVFSAACLRKRYLLNEAETSVQGIISQNVLSYWLNIFIPQGPVRNF